MRKFILAAAASALALSAAPAAASVTVSNGSIIDIPGSNDFQAQLNALGLYQYTAAGASITANSTVKIKFEYLGSESGFTDTFTAPGLSYVESDSNHFASPILIGESTFSAGSLAGLLNFSSDQGGAATVGDTGFGIFLPADIARGGFTLGWGQSFYLGYDDQIFNIDDNHDDFLIRATVTAVPEPATWAMMIMGFGVVGGTMRRRRGQNLSVRFA